MSLHFPSTQGLRIEDIVEVREKHVDTHEYFLRQLKTMLVAGTEGSSENVQAAITEIAEAMRLIDARYAEHRRKLKKIYVESAVAGAALVMGLLAKDAPNVFAIMSAIAGSSALKSLIDYSFERKLPGNIAQDPFFIPWQVSRLRGLNTCH